MAFNRKNQFLTLEKLYNSNDNEVAVFYSDKDSDLHDIIKEFLLNKDFFYYRAVQVSKDEQAKLFRESINNQLSKNDVLTNNYADIINVMMQEKCEKRVVVIDEFQNIIKYSNELIVEIIKCVNNKWGNQPVLFILLSTNVYFVENQMLEKMSESAYEISGLIKVPELNFVDVMRYFDKYSKEELIITYAVTGGKYCNLKCFDKDKSLKENIITNILSEDGFMYKKGFDLLPEELREHSVYNTILLNIANGNIKLNDLHKSTGYSRAKVSVYINNLIEHGIIEKIDSVDSLGRDNTLKGIYKISNSFTLFFYRFIYRNISILNIMDKEKYYKKYIQPYLYDFSQDTFKKVCNEFLLILNKMNKLPIKVSENGTWIGKVGNIDIVLSDDNDKNIICLCEFIKDAVSLEDFEWLKFCVSKAKITDDYYYLFTRKDFDERIKKYALETNNVILVDLSML